MSHILIVEDDDDIRSILKETLEMMGHKVTAAADGNQGYQNANEVGGYNLIITDYLMPKLDGLEMIEKIKEKSKSQKTPIIIFSTFKETITLLMAKYPDVCFVSKPGPLEKLTKKIEEQLAL